MAGGHLQDVEMAAGQSVITSFRRLFIKIDINTKIFFLFSLSNREFSGEKFVDVQGCIPASLATFSCNFQITHVLKCMKNVRLMSFIDLPAF